MENKSEEDPRRHGDDQLNRAENERDKQLAFTSNGLVCGCAQRRLSNPSKYGSQHLQILSAIKNDKENASIVGNR